jgi:hypothetical protein
MSLYAAILRTVLREARAEGWRRDPAHQRVPGLYVWVSPDGRIVVRVEPSPVIGMGMMQLKVSQRMYCGWVDIEVSQVGTWAAVIDVLAGRYIIDQRYASAWRHGQGAATDTIPRGTGEPAERFLAGLGITPEARPVMVLAAVRRHLLNYKFRSYAADLPGPVRAADA